VLEVDVVVLDLAIEDEFDDVFVDDMEDDGEPVLPPGGVVELVKVIPVCVVLAGFFNKVMAKKLPPRIITIMATIANTVVAEAKDFPIPPFLKF
jgi:hypothetical protein